MKRLALFLLCALIILSFTACNKKADEEPETPSTRVMMGTITEINDGVMTVVPDEGSWELGSSDKFIVPIENMDSSLDPMVGYKVEILYDGDILETYPASFGKIIHINVLKTVTTEAVPVEETESKTRAVFVDGNVYWDSGIQSDPMVGNLFIGITTADNVPDEFKNIEFELGLEYQCTDKDGQIIVKLDDGKCYYFLTDEARKELKYLNYAEEPVSEDDKMNPEISGGDPKAPEGFVKPSENVNTEPGEAPATTQPYFIELICYVEEIADDGSMICNVPLKSNESKVADYVYVDSMTDGSNPERADTIRIRYKGELSSPEAMPKFSGKEAAKFEEIVSVELIGVSGKK